MFYNCKLLYNIDGLKYLDTSKCKIRYKIYRYIKMLNKIKSHKKMDISKCINLSHMFKNAISNIKPLEKFDASKYLILIIYSLDVQLYQI